MKPKMPFSPLALPASAGVMLWLCLFVAASAMAQVPRTLTYQGFLTGGDGLALGLQAPRAYDVVFRVFNAESGGNLLWAEQQTVTVDKGYFSVQLGAGASVAGFTNSATGLSSVFSGNNVSERYVGLSVKGIGAGGSEVVIEPRVRLLSAPFAYLAQAAAYIVDSSGGTAIGSSASGVSFNRSLTASALSTPTGTAGSLNVSNSITFAASGATTGGGASFVRVSEGDVRLISGTHRWTNGVPGTGSAVFVTEPSRGYSVTRVSSGTYRVTFDTPFNGPPAVVVTPIQPALNPSLLEAQTSVNGLPAWPQSNGTFFPWAHCYVIQSRDPAVSTREVTIKVIRKQPYFIHARLMGNWFQWAWNGGPLNASLAQNDYNATRISQWSMLDNETDYDFQFHAVGP